MAGPELTPETFARGLFRMPPRGGGPSRPQVSYGNWGMFPEMDYQGIDGAVEIWWDTTVEAEDERGAIGTGVWRRSNGGDRFTIDEAPAPSPFSNPEDALTVVTSLPPEDTAPSTHPLPAHRQRRASCAPSGVRSCRIPTRTNAKLRFRPPMRGRYAVPSTACPHRLVA